MPRIVVPIALAAAAALSMSRSSSKCQGKITWARSLIIRFLSDRDAAARSGRRSRPGCWPD